MDLGLAKKSVVVTGGGSNIGRAIVLAFAKEEANITIGDIDTAQAEKVAQLANEAGAAGVQVVKTDVTNLAEATQMIGAADAKFGGIDVLVNNVGWDEIHYFMQTTPEFWQKVIQLNYVSVLNCTKAALELMVPKQSGSIVAISSDASRQGEPREAVYGGAKAAVNSFMKSIAKENGRYGIRCNAVCPGLTMPAHKEEVGNESMWADIEAMYSSEDRQNVAVKLPLRKLGESVDIANAVVFLASDAARYVTGQILSVSGGYSMIG